MRSPFDVDTLARLLPSCMGSRSPTMMRRPPHFSVPSRAVFALVASWSLLPLLLSAFAAAAATVESAETSPPGADGFGWAAFLGPFHVVLLHFPIGLLAAAFLVELLHLWRPAPGLRTASNALLAGTLLAGLLAAGTGWLRASEGGFEPDTLSRHRALAFATLGAVAVSLITQLAAASPSRSQTSRHLWTLAHRVGLLVGLGLVTAAGHFGGSLTHGSDFLTRNAPPAIAAWLVPAPRATAPAPSARAFADNPFTSRIRPMLEAKCYDCHGPEKHKGDYRLDVRETAFRGGDSGLPGIVPGDPMRSNLLRLALLPRDHDDAMPPDGKPALTPEEILALAHWIQTGAVWPESLAQTSGTNHVPSVDTNTPAVR